MDRGIILGLAHIRGGASKGYLWYTSGKYLLKNNTFTDFIDVAQFLIDEKYTSKNQLAAFGRSAGIIFYVFIIQYLFYLGGLLMGAIYTMRPDLFKVVWMQVPFLVYFIFLH
jgi:oligopeptidase B